MRTPRLSYTLMAWVIAGLMGVIGTAATASNTCSTTLSSGSGASLLKACVSNDGNLVQLESPLGFNQIGLANTFRDGYSVCTGNLPSIPNVVQGWDAGGEEFGFGASTIIQPHGPNTLPLGIIRDTTSGIYRLRQDFARDKTKKAITITMTLTRLTSGDCGSSGCPPVRLARYFEGDVDNNTVTNAAFAQDTDSVWEWINTSGNHGLMLSNLTSPSGVGYATTVHDFAHFDPTGSANSDPNPIAKGCIVFAGATATPTNPASVNATNLYGRVIYVFGNIALGKSVKVVVNYQRF